MYISTLPSAFLILFFWITTLVKKALTFVAVSQVLATSAQRISHLVFLNHNFGLKSVNICCCFRGFRHSHPHISLRSHVAAWLQRFCLSCHSLLQGFYFSQIRKTPDICCPFARFPPKLRSMCHCLYQVVTQRFQQSSAEAVWTVIGTVIFLRFINPAIGITRVARCSTHLCSTSCVEFLCLPSFWGFVCSVVLSCIETVDWVVEKGL